MICIEAIFVGEPKSITDENGTWLSAIYRTRVEGPIELRERSLAGDQVADTKNHGRPGQAVCVHPIKHYDFWNAEYDLSGARLLGPGSVGENWAISGGDEETVFCGDVYRVGTAIVQVSGPRMPCWKQERKLGLKGFLKQTTDSMRTGFYLKVVKPGIVDTGDNWELEDRSNEAISLSLVNQAAYRGVEPDVLDRVMKAESVVPGWKDILRARTGRGSEP
ncbi:MAG: MOSC domain-containing protein [Verrucomicrobia bacterium]|nr:MOSC domain-containing protein [Verrucomicrobiota bacterium]MBV8485217.1 MOSC domain-containing protein [Verrucomicrobiota bacterium]